MPYHVRMLTLFAGEDGAATKKRLNGELEKLRRAHPSASLVRASDPSVIPMVIECASQDALFGDPAIVVIDELLSQKDANALLAALPAIAASASYFLAFERKPKKELRDAIERAGGKVIDVTGASVGKPKKEVLPFSLTDAIARKDKRVAWMELLRLLRSGAAPEMIHGSIFWAVKSLLLAKDHTLNDAGKLGYTRAAFERHARAAVKWEREELIRTIEELVDMYHDAHSGGAPLDIRLERFVLGIRA